MIFVIISVLIGVVIGVYFMLEMFESLIGKIIGVFFGIPLGAVIIGFLGCLIPAIIGGILYIIDIPQERILIDKKHIYSVVDNKGIEGNFALGYGKVSDTLKYYYIVKDDLGQKIESVNAEKSHIINTDYQPEIKIYKTSFKNKVWDWVAFNFKEGDDYILEVPNNTIKYQYSIDLR